MRLLFPLLLLSVSGCTQKNVTNPLTEKNNTITIIAPINYDSCKKQVLHIKQENRPGWKGLSKNEKENIFTKAVTETIIPNWVGTAWSFNGVSEQPKQGSIACGYFVTTVLRDAGLNLARTKLAQCASEEMILSLIQPKYVQRFSNVAIENFIASVKQQGYGLYIIGLDNHTGFIYNDGSTIYFIHSTFVGTRNVQKEKAGESIVLKSSKYKVIGKLSADESVLERWIR
ncbi:MAG: hypothetical protein ABI666_06940 [Ferruginibacter sp.]